MVKQVKKIQKVKRTKTIELTIKESTQLLNGINNNNLNNINQRATRQNKQIQQQKDTNISVKKQNRPIAKLEKKILNKKITLQQPQVKQEDKKKKLQKIVDQKLKKDVIKLNKKQKEQQNKINHQNKKYINEEILREDKHELDQHHNFKEKYLGIEGQFSEFKILLGCFNGPYNDTLIPELKKRGFYFEVVQSHDDFIKKLHEFDQAWIFCRYSFEKEYKKKDQFLKQIVQFSESGKSLYLWTDNDPLYQEANLILNHMFKGMKLLGNYQGNKIIQRQNNGKLLKGTFDGQHPIAYGLNNIHEGITICHPENIHKDFKVFAFNSNNEPMIIYAEKNKNHGRIIVDTGFTKLYRGYWEKAGNHQYVSNASVWLSGVI